MASRATRSATCATNRRAPNKVEKWAKHLVERVRGPRRPYEVFEARRAGREAIWAWTVLTESA